MPCRVSSLARWMVLAAIFFIGAAPQAKSSQVTASGESAVTMFPEVRLRKLHLVRPDLIPYPVYYEVVC